ncbi:MAG TPA: HipA domain-containing protein [Microthrixaceae bacterium]|nr:HipA domain-containing protein [Microthrixaceae bacterium]
MADGLDVRRNGVSIATLRPTRRGLAVEYAPELIAGAAAGSIVLSCSVPMRSGRQDATGWARGLLPEGQHLLALAAAADVAASDTFGMLDRYGRDIAGAFEVVAVGASTREARAVPYGPGELDVEVAGLGSNPLGIHGDSELSLAGLQDKLVVVATADGWARPTHGYPSTHILKVDPPGRPGVVAAEAACLRLARAVGLTSIDADLGSFGGRSVLIVNRFDRTVIDGRVRRTHQEDLLHALGIPLDGVRGRAKYQPSGTVGPPSWWHAADLLDSHARDPLAELDALVRAVAFTTVIGNADCHAKNVAFTIADGAVRLAPLYDTVPTALWPDLRSSAALAVNDVVDAGAITVDDVVAEARRWRLSPERSRPAVIDLLEEVRAHLDVADHGEVVGLVDANLRRMLDGVVRS